LRYFIPLRGGTTSRSPSAAFPRASRAAVEELPMQQQPQAKAGRPQAASRLRCMLKRP
jgi:hypothetical protein